MHCYIQNMKALCLVVSEKMFFPIISLWDYLVPLKPEFISDLAQNIMQPFPYPDKILLQLAD